MVGTGIGATVRFKITNIFKQYHKKLIATFVVNMLGCLITGFLFPFAISTWYTIITLGFIGGFTTYSTFNNEIANLFLKKQKNLILLYTLSSYLLGLLLCFFGYLFTKLIFLNN